MTRYDPEASYDHGTGPAPRAWVARDPAIPVRDQAGIEFAAAVLDGLMAGMSPEDRGDLLDALGRDLAEGDFVSTTYLGCEPGDGA